MNSTFLGVLSASVLSLAAGQAIGQSAPPAAASPAATPATGHAVPFPHPLITEVLFNVPTGAKGDANGDGTRDAVGDEFVELINPHDKPIDLKGYVLTDSAGWPGPTVANPEAIDAAADDAAEGASPPKPAREADNKKKTPAKKPPSSKAPAAPKPGETRRGAVRFVFPSLVLKPGERVVVFNGYKQKFDGPAGGAGAAPAAKNPKFGEAFVFSMHNDSKFNSFSNTGDWVGLQSPSGEAVETLVWGLPKTLPPKAILSEEVTADSGSVQRSAIDGPFERHQDLPGDAAGKAFSPGEFQWSAIPGKSPANPK
ncbi:MAG: hypothetical protein WC718_12405 [Phycisphaerales bacterium]|jgi:hypothetical protein